jgi:hypothetical protein
MSPPSGPNDKITLAPSKERPTFKKTQLSDTSDEEDDINNTICSRKQTRPSPLDLKARRDSLELWMVGKQWSSHNLEKDLQLSSSTEESDDEYLKELADEIENNIM